MSFFLLLRDGDELSLLSARVWPSKQEALVALSTLTADPAFDSWDAEVLMLDLETGMPVLLVRPAEASGVTAVTTESLGAEQPDEPLAPPAAAPGLEELPIPAGASVVAAAAVAEQVVEEEPNGVAVLAEEQVIVAEYAPAPPEPAVELEPETVSIPVEEAFVEEAFVEEVAAAEADGEEAVFVEESVTGEPIVAEQVETEESATEAVFAKEVAAPEVAPEEPVLEEVVAEPAVVEDLGVASAEPAEVDSSGSVAASLWAAEPSADTLVDAEPDGADQPEEVAPDAVTAPQEELATEVEALKAALVGATGAMAAEAATVPLADDTPVAPASEERVEVWPWDERGDGAAASDERGASPFEPAPESVSADQEAPEWRQGSEFLSDLEPIPPHVTPSAGVEQQASVEPVSVEESGIESEASAFASTAPDGVVEESAGFETDSQGEYTCEDCVYEGTCPSKGERLPKDCISFQWK